jgi:uncharacterized membrane protein
MLDSGVSPTGDGSGEEVPIRAFWVILVIALILTAALGIFRFRQNDDLVDTKVHTQQKQAAVETQEVQPKARQASDMLGN